MKKTGVFLIAMMAATSLFADTIELADGRLLEGDFVGSSNGIIMFNTGEGIEAFPEAEVVGMWFSSGVATREAEMAQTGPAPTLSVPAGTRLVVRMSDSVDSSRHGAGHRFRGQLESAVVIDGVTVLPRGTTVDDVLHPISTEGMNAQTSGEGARTVGRTARAAAIGGLIDGSSGARTGAKVGAGVSILTSGASVNVPRGTIVETSLRVALVLPM
jgi:hypothetical protein